MTAIRNSTIQKTKFQHVTNFTTDYCASNDRFGLNFDEYIRQGNPQKKERAEFWRVAIGLQAVDGLKVSDYLLELARRNIEGEISWKRLINSVPGRLLRRGCPCRSRSTITISQVQAYAAYFAA